MTAGPPAGASRPAPAPTDPVVLKVLRRARRRQRVAAIHWADAAYHAYVAGIVGLVIVLFVSGIVGGSRVAPATLARVLDEGPGWLGLAWALALAVGVRSGSRGGPLALEPAEVRYVLLAPVPRGAALRPLALKQLRFGLFVGTVAGAIAGQLAVRRLGGAPLAWVAVGALAGAVLALTLLGAAMVASGLRVRRWQATALGAVALASAGTAAAQAAWSPFSWFGRLVLWPIEAEPLDALPGAVVPVLAALAVTVAGLVAVRGVALEAAERRTGLVEQLRFAVTVQDLRSVVLLRRQLALDLPRQRPWVRLARLGRRWPVARRGLLGLLRFPLARLGRLVLLGVVAGVCVRGAVSGTTPLLFLAGLALYVAALDAVEPLAQQVDHADRTDELPVVRGDLYARHLPVPVLTMVLVASAGWAAGVLLAPSAEAAATGAVLAAGAVLCSTAGAAVSTVMPPPEPFKDGQLLPPEVAGMKVALRAALPLVVAVVGVWPARAVARALAAGDPPLAAASSALLLPVVVGAAGLAWVRSGERLGAWWREQQEMAMKGGATR